MLKGSCSTTSLHDFLYLTSFSIVSLIPQPPEQTFQDVVGVDEAKSELLEIVDFLRNPEKFTRLGGKMTKGSSSSLLLYYSLASSLLLYYSRVE